MSDSYPRRKASRIAHGIARGVQDRTTVDVTQIRLILRTELNRALERALHQIEAVLREPYPEIRPEDE
jgi:hypothetical protein